MKMKILVVQESDWIERGPHQNHHLMERLSKKGHEVRVIDYEIMWRSHSDKSVISKRKIFENEWKAVEGGGVTVIRPSIIKLPVLDYLSLLYTHGREIKRQLYEFNPDVIIGFGILNSMLSLKLTKKPFIYYLIDTLHRLVPQKVFQPLARYIESTNIKKADRVIVINEGLKEYAINIGAKPEKALVIRAGIDLQKYEPKIDGKEIREKYGIKKGDHVLFFMGWLYQFSGLKEVATELSKTKGNNIKLLIVGDGEAFNDLQTIREKYGLQDKIILAGKQPYDTIPKFIASSNICLLPAYNNEIMKNIVPIKMYEYMAMAKPVIATKLPGIIKEFGYNNGVIYVEKPEEALNKAIKLIKAGDTEEEGRKARKFVEKQDWNKITNEFERILEEIIQCG